MAVETSSDTARTRATPGDPGFGLYVHWPFCRAKCPYCDFNSHVAADIDHRRWAEAFLREIDRYADEVGPRRLDSIYFGGGTPSLMAPATVEAVIGRASSRFRPTPDIEITLEANPTSVEAERLAGFRAAGVNRLSLGIQSLHDQALRFFGREHTAAEALAALEVAARLFARISFDLIYARPGQTLASWRRELAQALDHAGGHISLYQLTIEPGTPFARLRESGRLTLPDEAVQADLYEFTCEYLAGAGYAAYEVSNFARPGEQSRHNLIYWRSGTWLGIGPGAHGRLDQHGARLATEAWRLPKAWLQQVEERGSGERWREALGTDAQIAELLVMGLRLGEGLEITRIEAIGKRPIERILDQKALENLIGEGLLMIADGRLIATPAGRLRLDSLLAALLP